MPLLIMRMECMSGSFRVTVGEWGLPPGIVATQGKKKMY